MELELETSLKSDPELGQYSVMMSTLFLEYGLEHVEYQDESKLSEDELHHRIYQEADWVGFPVYAKIDEILLHVPPGKVPVIPESEKRKPQYGTHDSNGMKDFVGSVIHELFPEACILKAIKKNGEAPMVIGAQDELMLDFEHIFRVRTYPSAMIFGVALYIDIRYVLEDEVSNAFTQMQGTASEAHAALMKLASNLARRGKSSRLRDEARNRAAEINAIILEDVTAEDKKRRFAQHGMTEPFERHFLLKRDPIWSGLLDLRCRLVTNNLGYKFISSSSIVLAAAFLYYASRQAASGDPPSWPAMDKFLRVHEEDRVLMGTVPRDATAHDILSRFIDYDVGKTTASSIAGFTVPSKSLEALHERYAWDSGQSRRSMTYLREILREKFNPDIGTDDTLFPRQAIASAEFREADGVLAQNELTIGDTNGPPAGAGTVQRAKPSQRTTQVQLLEILAATTSDLLENQLSVDYFQVYDESILYLELLLETFGAEAEKYGLSTYVSQETDPEVLARVVPAIHEALSGPKATENTENLVKRTREFVDGRVKTEKMAILRPDLN